MKRKQILLCLPLLALLSTTNYQVSAGALGTSFTYQGRLNDGANPANGSYDLTFTLYDEASSGTAVAGPITNSAAGVSNGLFTVALDFGASVFTGEARWLEIGVRTNAVGDFVTLTPRQPITPAPYALHARSVSVPLLLTGAAAPGTAVFSVGSTGAGVAIGASSTNGDIAVLGKDNTAVWGISPSGFAGYFDGKGYFSGTVGIGTNNPQSALHVAGTVTAADFAGSGAGLTVLNGGALVDGSISSAKIANGTIDTIDVASIEGDKIVGGDLTAARLKVGINHSLSGTYATIAGGQSNTNLGNASALGGGYNNTIQTNASNATIGGGGNNTIQTNASNATIGGGLWNTIQRGTYAATIGGGYGNNITSNVQFACIPGGYNNAAASYAFAAGNRAKANHTGAFVWADATGADFASGADNQFLIRASGGVGIGTNNPQSALHVAGTLTAESFAGSGAGLTEISGAGLTDGSVTSAKIADGAVDSDQLASNAVTAVKLDPTIGVWAKSGTNISYSAGNVGFGTTDPQTALHVSGNVQLDKQGNTPGRLVLNTVNRNDPDRYGIQFKNNVLAPFLGDDTQPSIFAFMSAWSDQRINNATIRAYGKATNSFGNYLALTHNGTNGFILTDVGHLLLTPAGNVGIGTTSPTAKLDVAGTVQAQTVTITSDREAKQDFAPVDTKEILKRLAALPIQTWTYKAEAGTRHLGPVAQDFHAAFGVGADDKHIATVDADGAALAAIQGLYQMVKEKDSEIGELKRRLASLESALAPEGSGGAARSASSASAGF